MSKFNTPAARKTYKRGNTTNRAGGEAYVQSDKVKLASILLTSFVKDQFYRSSGDTQKELIDLINKVEPEFAAKAAIYARNEFGMRSITHIVGAEIPHTVKGEKWTKDFVDLVIRRPDDATEILSYYLGKYGKPVPNSLKKGLAKGLSKFDAYQLAKYRADKKAVSLVDILNLVHAKPSAENAAAFEALIDGDLKSEGTWEQRISEAGKSENKVEAKKEAWAELVRTKKIGQFALLRNLRNIETQAPEVLDEALALLVQETRIKKSLIMPFRYVAAAGEVSETKTLRALNKAVDISCSNVPYLTGKTLIAVDHSGSMGGGYSYYGSRHTARDLTAFDYTSNRGKADLFAAILVKASDADVMVFGDHAEYVKGLNPDDSTLTLQSQINKAQAGHSTNFTDVLVKANKRYDRIVTISDMQAWVGYYSPAKVLPDYERKYNAKPFLYNIDLTGYGESMFPTERTFELAGYSEKIFDIMKVLEQDKNAMVSKIEAVALTPQIIRS